MKKLFLFCVAACLSVVVSAQRVYFLYLQTDDQTPFYVRVADKIYSSSTAGYLILPNLTDSTYLLNVGFPKSAQPETRFSVAISQNDKGYLLKNFSDGLSLFDVEALTVLKPVNAGKDNTVYETKTDKFSSVLSKAAEDPSLLKVPAAKKEEAKPVEPAVTVAKKAEPKPTENVVRDTVVASSAAPVTAGAEKAEKKETTTSQPVSTTVRVDSSATPVVTTSIPDPAPKTAPAVSDYKASVIVRRSESSTTEGFGIVYYDRMENAVDTVRILIPPSKGKIDDEVQTASLSEVEKKPAVPAGNATMEMLKADTKVTESPQPSVVKPRNDDPTAKQRTTKTAVGASCKETATDKDFMKVRRNMAAKENDEAMIEEAKKVFKTKCFTTEQVRYLSTLFLTSAAKYQFFDAVYNHVVDKENFQSLQAEVKDDYYLKRFKALIGE